MYQLPTSARQSRFLAALRGSHTLRTTATHRNLIGGASTSLPVLGGSVTDDSTSNVRRTLTCTLAPDEATWDELDTVGAEITVKQVMRYVDGSTEAVPMGVFILDQDNFGYAPGDVLTVQVAPDRWGKVQKVKLAPSQRSSVASNTLSQEIKRLVEGAWAVPAYPFPGWAAGSPDMTATAKVGPLVWADGNREAAILDLCTTAGFDCYFDRSGLAVLQPKPTLTDTSRPVWLVNAGENGVLVSAERNRDRAGMSNVVIVSTSAADVTFVPVEVALTTAGDPLATTGPLGYVSSDYSSPTIRSSAQARTVGKSILSQRVGVAKRLSLESAGNPLLDSLDVIQATLPRIDRNTPRPVELHILDTVVHPFESDGQQQLSTRSTRPASDGG